MPAEDGPADPAEWVWAPEAPPSEGWSLIEAICRGQGQFHWAVLGAKLTGVLAGSPSQAAPDPELGRLLFILWPPLVEREAVGEIVLTGYRFDSYELERIATSFLRTAKPAVEGTLRVGDAVYHGVRVWAAPDQRPPPWEKISTTALPRQLTAPPTHGGKGGRPSHPLRLHFYQEAMRLALSPDGFETRKELRAHMAQWCDKNCLPADRPDERTFQRWLTDITPPELP